MSKLVIIRTALERLEKTASISGEWKPSAKPSSEDGKITFMVDGKPTTLPVTIRRELRKYQVPSLNSPAGKETSLLVVAERIPPSLREELRQANVSYLEANGNFFLRQPGIYILIDGQPPNQTKKPASNRAFTPAGLRVVFHFLLDARRVNDPYRAIAEQTETSVGHVKNVMEGLKAAKFILPENDKAWQLVNKKELLDRWTNLYGEKLKPTLAEGTFRFANFVDPDKSIRWQDLSLQVDKTCWGGEPAADLLTNHLRPGPLTLYTSEERAELMVNYRILPDEGGDIKIYRKFWHQAPQNTNIAPPLLVYADLINQGDKRSRETADIIYEQYLRDQF